MSRTKEYPEKFAVKLPEDFRAEIQNAAKVRYMSSSEFIRQSVLEKLQREQQPKPAA
jgi:Arc/MetJ-type ribon-helix-helix transcriptional regulator